MFIILPELKNKSYQVNSVSIEEWDKPAETAYSFPHTVKDLFT